MPLRLHRTRLCVLVQSLLLLLLLRRLQHVWLQSPEARCTAHTDVRRRAQALRQALSALETSLTCARLLRSLERLHRELLSKRLPEHPAALPELQSRLLALLALLALLHRVGV